MEYFFLLININIRVSLRALRLISQAVKLMTMQASSGLKGTQTHDYWEANPRLDQ